MSFILDALRKSEHERQRSAVPGLAHVPVAPVPAAIPRWAVFVMAFLAAAVLVLAVAWWRSTREGVPEDAARISAVPPPVVERSLPVPPPAPMGASATTAQPPAAAAVSRSLADTAGSPATEPPALGSASEPSVVAQPSPGTEALPSAASLAAEGITLPTLRLELHGYAEQPSARFVFINGRKYGEGERLADGPELVAVEPRGAVLSYAGRRFLLLPE